VELLLRSARVEMTLFLNIQLLQTSLEGWWAVSDPIQQDLGRTTPFTPSAFSPRPTQVPAANLTYAYAGFGAVLGILFGVATAATMHQTTQIAQQKPSAPPAPAVTHEVAVVHAGFVLPEEKDMGSVNSRTSGLRGHLTTSWSERLAYHFVVGPTDPAQNEAFAATVNDSPRPLSVDLQMKSAAGEVLCGQQVVVKYDPRKAAGQNPSQIDQLEAQESSREHSADVFQNDLNKDGKIESISSRGVLPCSKQEYDSAAFWSFSPQFPDLREQSRHLQHPAVPLVMAKSSAPEAHVASKSLVSHELIAAEKLPSAPVVKLASAPKVANVAKPISSPKPASVYTAPSAPAATDLATVVQKAVPFHFEIEGDDEIVDFDASQKSLETSAGKTFYVNETLVASSVAGWLDEQANIHYRCDETSSCTLSLASAPTLLHATMRAHHGTLTQPDTTLSMSVGQGSTTTGLGSGQAPVGPQELGR